MTHPSYDEMKETETLQHEDLIKKKFKIKAGVFLGSLTGISVLVGFGSALAYAKKKDPLFFNRGMVGSREMTETGASLAMRALGWGTLYAFGGCGLLFYGLWKLSGAQDFKEFRQTMGSILPRIPKNNPPQGRTEFEGLTDLLSYISNDGRTEPSPAKDS
ncbi:transmembrane protein 242 [Anabrus simplex]|uniref:transmembrane protein 242 n=1 Tax=Anabrus simplex TaxID=316456 RepID=UPI0034DD1648